MSVVQATKLIDPQVESKKVYLCPHAMHNDP